MHGGVFRKGVAADRFKIEVVGGIGAACLKFVAEVIMVADICRDQHAVFIPPFRAVPRAAIRLIIGDVRHKVFHLHACTGNVFRRDLAHDLSDLVIALVTEDGIQELIAGGSEGILGLSGDGGTLRALSPFHKDIARCGRCFHRHGSTLDRRHRFARTRPVHDPHIGFQIHLTAAVHNTVCTVISIGADGVERGGYGAGIAGTLVVNAVSCVARGGLHCKEPVLADSCHGAEIKIRIRRCPVVIAGTAGLVEINGIAFCTVNGTPPRHIAVPIEVGRGFQLAVGTGIQKVNPV